MKWIGVFCHRNITEGRWKNVNLGSQATYLQEQLKQKKYSEYVQINCDRGSCNIEKIFEIFSRVYVYFPKLFHVASVQKLIHNMLSIFRNHNKYLLPVYFTYRTRNLKVSKIYIFNG